MTRWKDATLYELESSPIATHYVNLDLCRKEDVLRGGWKLRGCWYHYDKQVIGPHGPLLPIRVEQLSEGPGLFIFRDYIPLGWIPKLQNYVVPVMRAEQVPPTSDWPAGEPSMANFACKLSKTVRNDIAKNRSYVLDFLVKGSTMLT